MQRAPLPVPGATGGQPRARRATRSLSAGRPRVGRTRPGARSGLRPGGWRRSRPSGASIRGRSAAPGRTGSPRVGPAWRRGRDGARASRYSISRTTTWSPAARKASIPSSSGSVMSTPWTSWRNNTCTTRATIREVAPVLASSVAEPRSCREPSISAPERSLRAETASYAASSSQARTPPARPGSKRGRAATSPRRRASTSRPVPASGAAPAASEVLGSKGEGATRTMTPECPQGVTPPLPWLVHVRHTRSTGVDQRRVLHRLRDLHRGHGRPHRHRDQVGRAARRRGPPGVAEASGGTRRTGPRAARGSRERPRLD